MELMERFWKRVEKTETCWNWNGSNVRGYGAFSTRHAVRVRAHRFAYEALVGKIPEGLQIDHLCKNTLCVNPAHLEPVTAWVNVMRSSGVAAVNSAKSKCPNGHDLSGDNLAMYQLRTGKRTCRICSNARLREKRRLAA
jgi:hypothetical protein